MGWDELLICIGVQYMLCKRRYYRDHNILQPTVTNDKSWHFLQKMPNFAVSATYFLGIHGFGLLHVFLFCQVICDVETGCMVSEVNSGTIYHVSI